MEIPLFPLNTVLFPGATMPLHIFEERYKLMVGRCLDDKSPFGIVLIESGREVGGPAEPVDVGTTAHINRVERLSDGKMNLICQGGRRFTIRKIIEATPYLVGDVEFLDEVEENDERTAALVAEASLLFKAYAQLYLALSHQWSRSVETPSSPNELADFIGSRLGVDALIKQGLLEELVPSRRLKAEIDLLHQGIEELAPQVDAVRTTRWRGFGVLG